MFRLVVFATLLAAAHAAFTCRVSGETDQNGDCSATFQEEQDGKMVSVKTIDMCYFAEGNSGCVPEEYASVVGRVEGCNLDACWCTTKDCNSAAWYEEKRANWVPPPMCYTGVAGANTGAECYDTAKSRAMEFESPDCHGRAKENQCVENTEWMDEGDGCGDQDSKSACESYQATDRDADESYDGTTRKCRWLPRFEDAEAKTSACQRDGQCTWRDPGYCDWSDASDAEQRKWEAKRGQSCDERAPSGCYENNDGYGQNEACTQHTSASACTSFVKGPNDHFGSNGVCSGDLKDASGGDCRSTPKQHELQPEYTDCSGRTEENYCVENNAWIGRGDGCMEHSDQQTCESYRATDRGADESFDGTTRHCRWLPPVVDKVVACESDYLCSWYSDRGHHENGQPVGSCDESDEARRLQTEFDDKVGLACERRAPRSGCYENNDHLGQNEACTQHADVNSCTTFIAGSDDHIGCPGTCEGTLNANSGDTRQCAERWDEHGCGGHDGTDNGCTWTEQCCKWIPESANTEEECLTNGAGTEADMCSFEQEQPCSERGGSEWDCTEHGGKDNGCTYVEQACKWVPPPADPEHACLTSGVGTEPDMCAYTTGVGPPRASMIEDGFEHALFRLSDEYNGRCAVVASFRAGKGSATVLGVDAANIIDSQCERPHAWHDVAEHIGHTRDSIDEYCANFLEHDDAMDALKAHAPSEIISLAKQGKFEALIPGLSHLQYIVTRKPQFGECLLAGNSDFGFAICTCDTAECNDKESLEFIVDPAAGPMRLLQFIDGSLVALKDAINAIVPNILNAEGQINPANVAQVTEANVDEIMTIAEVAALTTKEELWGIIQDYQRLQGEIEACTANAADCNTPPPQNGINPGGNTGSNTAVEEAKEALELAQQLVASLGCDCSEAVDSCSAACDGLAIAADALEDANDSAWSISPSIIGLAGLALAVAVTLNVV